MTLTEKEKLTAEITARLLCCPPKKFKGQIKTHPMCNQVVLAANLAKDIIKHSVLINRNT